MLAPLTAPVRSFSTPTQVKVATDPGRSPSAIAAEISVVQPVAEAAYGEPVSAVTVKAVKRLDALNEEIIAAVIRERPALGARAQYQARLAETAHHAYLEGTLTLEARNRHATAAAETRQAILSHAQEYLDAAGAGYLANSSVKELHHVAV